MGIAGAAIFMQKLNNLKEKLGEKKFEKLMVEAAPRAEEIVRKMLEGASA